jgi:Zn-dependent M28 family amino/carboxypeptidase
MAGSAIAPDAAPAAASRVDAGRLIADVKTLADPMLSGRLTGSGGSRRARAFLLERFRELGLHPVNGVVEQTFSFTHNSIPGLVLPSRPFKRQFDGATNVMGMLQGSTEPDRFILVTAHYDHLGVRDGKVYPGADDNASGVAGMLAAAAWFSEHRPRRSIVFVAFDGEEQGLQGARHFVQNPPFELKRIDVVVNMDMIGRGEANTLVVAGTHFHPWLRPVVADAAHGRQITVVFGHDRPFVAAAHVEDWTQSSDHGPFHDAGIPFLYFGVEDHADYHHPTDTVEKIPVPFFVEATNLVIETVRRLAT